MALSKEYLITVDKFFGGIVRDDKSRVQGAASNVEEFNIFENENYIIPEQVMSADAMPADTEIYAYTAGDDDVVYGYGKKTTATVGTVRLVSVASGGASNPGTFGALFTSADTTNLASLVSDFKFFRSTEASNATSLYYIQGASTTWYLVRYNIGAAAEQIWNGSAWAAGSSNASSDLTGLNGTNMRPTMKVIFGDLYICHGQFVAKVAADGTFTEKAFTLPKEWEAVDIIAVSDIAIILARNKNVLINESRGFWWDLVSSNQFDDQFVVPMGGPCWIYDHRETIKILTAINGQARLWQLSGAFPGAVPIELPNISISNVQADASTQPISSPKMVSQKDKILYFGLYKTDKTGIYGLGQLDSNKPNALVLSKRFIPSGTSDYANHKPVALLIQGPNFYASYYATTTSNNSRCESNNSPNRSSDAVYESVWIDNQQPYKNKELNEVLVATYPLVASTSVAGSAAVDYSSSYTSITRADATSHNTANELTAKFNSRAFSNKKAFKIKLAATSATTSGPKIQNFALRITEKSETASKT